jgi:hypothetical protein
MCWKCDHPEVTRAEYLELLQQRIDARGWITMCIEDKNPFSYTVGLHARGAPEFLVTGLDPGPATWLLNTMARRVYMGAKIPVPGTQRILSLGPRVEFVEVGYPMAHMGIGVSIEGPDVRAIQMVWADGRGRWPWAANFDGGQYRQPVLGHRAGHAEAG